MNLWKIPQLPDFTTEVEPEGPKPTSPMMKMKGCPNPKCGNFHVFEKVETREFSYCPVCGWTAEDLKQYLAARDQV